MQHIAVFGTGSWGTALAILLAKNGLQVSLWGVDQAELKDIRDTHENSRYLPGIKLPPNITVYSEMTATLKNVRDLILAIPSHAFDVFLTKLKPHFTANMRLAWGSKGLDARSQLLHETASTILGEVPLAVISGPSFAREVALGLPTAVTVATTTIKFGEDLANYFHNDSFRVYTSDDIIGVEICGAVKNVLAIAVGISDGMNFGANTRAALITRGLKEMTRLGIALGGKSQTFTGLSGLGDLVLTATDNQSRNRRFGIALGQGLNAQQAKQDIGQIIEGVINAKEIYRLAQNHKVDMPIVTKIYQIIYEQLPVKTAAAALLQRERKSEL